MARGAVVGNLRVNMGLDSAQFQKGLNQAQSSAERFSRGLRTAMVAAAGAAAAALGAVSVAVKRTISSANELGYVADRLGVNIERLQELRYAAERSGMSVQNFDVALRRFVRRAAEAAKGTGAAKNAFSELGVQLHDVNGRLRPSEELLHDVADAMRGIQSPADKLRLAFQMFDTDGAAMVNVLANGSQGMKELADEAQRLGLVLSENTVRASQTIANNFDLAGKVIGGMVNRLTEALAPALVLVSEAVVTLALKFHDLIDILPTVAEYAAVAGGALAVMAAPSLIASVGALAVAIGTHLVGAVRLLTAVIAANPLGAIAVGIAVAVTAIYHFRDEIKQAISIDVVQIVKDAANLIIGSFYAAYADIEFLWKNFPNIIGAAAIGAVNAVIRGVNAMVQKAAEGIDWLINKINLIPGVDISPIGSVDPLPELENQYFTDLKAAVAKRNKVVEEALNFDYIGQIGKAFEGATPGVMDFTSAIADANAQLDEMGGGSGGGGRGKLGSVKDNLKSATDEMRQFADSVASTIANAFQSLIDGSKSVKDVLRDLLRQLSSLMLNQAFRAIVGGLFGFGGFFGGFGSLPGFATGGSFTVGGAGGVDSQLVAFRATPGEMVDIRKPGQDRAEGLHVTFGLASDGALNIMPEVRSVSRQESMAATEGLAKRIPAMVDRRDNVRNTRRTRA